MPDQENQKPEKPTGLLNAVDRVSTSFTNEDEKVLAAREEVKSESPQNTKVENGFKLQKFERETK